MAYVVKSWKASNTPVDQSGHYVEIIGRKAGLIAWLAALVGIDPTVKMCITSKWLELHETSLSGTQIKQIPLRKVSSVLNGYHRPWRKALVIFVVSMVIPTLLPIFGILVALIGAAIALLYYFLNRPFQLYVYEVGGAKTGISFKRSVIENVEVDHPKVQYVCEIIKCLVEAENT